jgi:multiple sugar transport system permease protein
MGVSRRSAAEAWHQEMPRAGGPLRLVAALTRTQRRRETLWAVAFLTPFFIGLVFFIAGPVVAAFLLSLTNWDLMGPPQWAGLQNYVSLAQDPLFWQALGNTVYYTGVSVPVGLALALMLAVLMNRKVPGIYAFRVIYFAPVTVSIVAVSLLWAWLYSPSFGFLNYVLSVLHLPTLRWLVDPHTAMPSVILVGLWRGLGFNIIVFIAGLQAIPRDLYEAAEIDGANEWQQFRRVTLPMLSPTLFFAIVMALISSFQVFEQTYIMTQGGPGNSTLTFIYYIFLTGFTYLRMGYASALSFVFLALILTITVLQVRWQARWVHYDA